ncbi:MAG: hypothetical protein SAK29_42235 [Scytonema sp. PMC 1069.18]|nr:hypothetical protein [Scytonema sp. PMC 1069.18]MEC4886880.1 hypothetical protein [Scytonema sp. PMC 1070.18]
MKISFIDSGVLVTAARSIGELSEKALSMSLHKIQRSGCYAMTNDWVVTLTLWFPVL